MFIVSGVYHFKKRNVIAERTTCPYCGERGQILKSFDGYRVGHLYFIPLIPVGYKRVIRQCECCRRFIMLTPSQLASARAANLSKILELLNSEPLKAVDRLVDQVHLGDTDGVDQALRELGRRPDDGLAAIAKARVMELTGRADEAERLYRTVLDNMNYPGQARYRFGCFLLEQNREDEAIEQLRAAKGQSASLNYLELLKASYRHRICQNRWHGILLIMQEILSVDPAQEQEEVFSRVLAAAREEVSKQEAYPR